jgi:hypothetical protein
MQVVHNVTAGFDNQTKGFLDTVSCNRNDTEGPKAFEVFLPAAVPKFLLPPGHLPTPRGAITLGLPRFDLLPTTAS